MALYRQHLQYEFIGSLLNEWQSNKHIQVCLKILGKKRQRQRGSLVVCVCLCVCVYS